MEATIQLQSGALALPTELCNKYAIKDGATFRVIDLDGIFLLTPTEPMVTTLALEIERARVQAGLSTGKMLKTLRAERKRYHKEKYSRKNGRKTSRVP